MSNLAIWVVLVGCVIFIVVVTIGAGVGFVVLVEVAGDIFLGICN